MVSKRFKFVILLLVIAALLPGPASAGRAAVPQAAPQIGLLGQLGGESYSVALQGSYAYLGLGPRLAVVNLSDPANPVLAGRSVPLPDIVQGIAVSGNTVVRSGWREWPADHRRHKLVGAAVEGRARHARTGAGRRGLGDHCLRGRR